MQKQINLQYTTITRPVPQFIYSGLQEYVTNANGYKPQPQVLIHKIAEQHNLPKENIFLTAGATDAIQMCALAYGRSTYIFTPTFIVYNLITELYANVNQIYALKEDNYEISTDTISDATLIYLANPNNPFGFTSTEKVLALVKNNPQATVVVDEVYAEFANLSVIQEVKNFPNLVVIRSFSKSYSLAAARIGYIVASPEIIAAVTPKTQWCNVSYLSVGAAVEALHHGEYFLGVIKEIGSIREEFAEFLKDKGLRVLPSAINAVLINFDTEEKGSAFVENLAQKGITVSHGNGNSNVGLDNSFVRIAIGTKEEMEFVKEVISNSSSS